jgi:hypothetical protein
MQRYSALSKVITALHTSHVPVRRSAVSLASKHLCEQEQHFSSYTSTCRRKTQAKVFPFLLPQLLACKQRCLHPNPLVCCALMAGRLWLDVCVA